MAVPHTYVMMRLNRWAVYCIWRESLLVSSPKPKHVRSWWGLILSNRVHDPDRLPAQVVRPCPVDVVEAEETDRCVQSLPGRLRCVIILDYLTNMTKKQRVSAMKPSGCPQTYYNRLEWAHYELLGLFNDTGAGIELRPVVSARSVAA
jgi:hypothetical protein